MCNADALMHFLLVWLLVEFVAKFCDVDALYISAILSISVCCALMLFDANAGGIFCPVWGFVVLHDYATTMVLNGCCSV